MKKAAIAFLCICCCAMFTACTSENSEKEYQKLLQENEKLWELVDELQARKDSLEIELDRVPETIDEQLDYYEQLCDMHGLLTYEEVYSFEAWKHYAQNEIYHNDWLCTALNRDLSYLVVANTVGFTPCPTCTANEQFYYLDEESGIYHQGKSCLEIGTDDFKSPWHNYRFIAPESAEHSHYIPCDICIK